MDEQKRAEKVKLPPAELLRGEEEEWDDYVSINDNPAIQIQMFSFTGDVNLSHITHSDPTTTMTLLHPSLAQ